MYYFSKLETENKNEMLFGSEVFKRDNVDNFHLIQRRNKGRDDILKKIHEEFAPILKTIKDHKSLTQETKDIIIASI